MNIEEAKELITEGLGSADYPTLIAFMQEYVEHNKQHDLVLLEDYLESVLGACIDVQTQIQTREMLEGSHLETILEEGYNMVDAFTDELQNQIRIVHDQIEVR